MGNEIRIWEGTASDDVESYDDSVNSIVDGVLLVGVVLTLVFLLGLFCRCCFRRSRGRVLAPPPTYRAWQPTPASAPQQTHFISSYPAPVVAPPPTVTDCGFELKPSNVKECPPPYEQAMHPGVQPSYNPNVLH